MANMEQSPANIARRGVRRSKKYNVRIDMTPMVDLGFLLITFFVMTARLAEPATMPLIMPDLRGSSTIGETNALTIIFNKDRVYWYQGNWQKALNGGKVLPTTLDGKSGLGNIIRQRQALLDKEGKDSLGREGLMLLIKPGPDAIIKPSWL